MKFRGLGDGHLDHVVVEIYSFTNTPGRYRKLILTVTERFEPPMGWVSTCRYKRVNVAWSHDPSSQSTAMLQVQQLEEAIRQTEYSAEIREAIHSLY